MTNDALRLSAVVPVFNEKENLEPLVEELGRELGRLEVTFEILLVDDGSTDGSTEVMDRLARRYPAVRAIHLHPNQGQSAALATGFDAALGQYLVTLDADLQNDPADIARLFEWIPQYDMVVGIRRTRRDSWSRRASSTIANRVRSLVLGDGIRDTGCSLKLFRRDLTPRMPRFRGMHRFLPFLAQLQGAQIMQVPVNHRPRRAGRSKYNVSNRLGRGLVDLVGMWWLKRRYVGYQVSYEAPAGVPHGGEPTRVDKEAGS